MWPLKKNEPEDAADDEAKASRRSLVRRLDIFFASYCVLAYTMKYIDQQAHTNAYVSGMKEDLHLVGNELNMINAMFSVGYAVGTIPSQILVAKFRPSLVIPLFEVTWSLLIMVNAAAKNAGLLYGMRLLIGLLESIAYPGFISTLTAWYTPAELAKRIALVQASSAAGSMFSGYLAAGMLKGMQGVGGLEAWRWLFIFDGCISLPIAIAGFFCIPDHPETTRVKWLRPEHIQQARDRMREIGRAPKGRLTVAKFLKIFNEWPIYLMLAIYPFEIVTSQAISYFALYLKSNPSGRTFTQYQVNLIPTGGQALQIVATLIFASLSDRLGRRWQVLCCQVGLGVIGYTLLNAWDSVGFNGQFAGYMLIYCTVGSGALSLTWYSEFCSADAEIRTLIIGLCNGIGYAFIAGFPFIMFPNVQAPRYKVGYKMGLAFYLWTIVGSILIAFLLRRYGRPYTKTATQEADDESVRSQSREDHGDIEQKLEEPVPESNAKERSRTDEVVPQLRN